ncbi:MAG: UbiH/UbiF/VisC/COQ6 family ubiquinone biosynthesis hydroxylase [Alphaproteobacteria bacterium]
MLIVGGGMVGMSLAAALGGAGARVAVIEPTPPEQLLAEAFDGRTSAIAAGSRAVLDSAGAWSGMAEDAQPILDIRVTDGASPLFLHYDHREVGGEPMGHILENRVIRRALLDRLAALPTVTLLAGRRAIALDRDGARATATLDDGACVVAALAVATDGRGSPTRSAAGIGVTEWRYPQVGIVCTVTHERDHRGIAQEHFLPAGPFAILPMTGRRSSIVWTERTDLAPALLALDDDAFLEELRLRFGDYLGALGVEGPRFSYPLGLLHADRYVAGRLVLAGDAAHAMHPIAGQGFNLGLRDVAALAEVVIDALRLGLDPGASTVLARYESWRRFDNTLMLAATDGLNRLFSNDAAPLRLARDAGLAAVDRLAPLKRLFMRHAMGQLGDLPRMMRGEPV